ncbi:porin [Novosphingobium profundi]|uniref:DcaP family trimeric outer membrane transporter n=1 Tax=Novosphingobium profundi TaxID=1774954 RepID=UPI001BDB45F6|nr:DcaP family trimeric outer membrane transporter [Novosphingobium profundi]MBT0668137.1 porin [Novosphingobium profundi]
MTDKHSQMAGALAFAMTVALVPGLAHADDAASTSGGVQAQLRALAEQVKDLQRQQTELRQQLAASEAERARMGQAAPDAMPLSQSQPELATQVPASQPAAGGRAVIPEARSASRETAHRSRGPARLAEAAQDGPPPGTIAPNPYLDGVRQPVGQGLSFTVPGTDTRVTLGGLIKLDVFDDLTGANLNGWPEDAVSIPIEGTTQSRRKHNFSMTARQTRFSIGSETPTSMGTLRSFIEGDFYGTGGTALLTNSAAFRLRQAYISLGKFTFGQTWSVFTDLPAAAETLDFTGPVGNAYAMRQPLIRYETKLGQRGQLTVGVENPEADFLGADHTSNFPVGSTLSTRVLNQVPDITMRYTYQGERLRISTAGVLRYINLDTGGQSLAFLGPDGNAFYFAGKASTWAFGGQIDATLKTFGHDTLTAEVNGGPGIGRYMMGVQDEAFAQGVAPYGATNANPGNGAVLRADGTLDPIFAYGASLWYRHFWSKTLRSNLVAGYLHNNDPHGALPINFPEQEATLHANVIWSPVPQVAMGIEYIHGYLGLRGQTDANQALGYGDHGEMDRLQFSVQYKLF